jgi:transcriptional regulator with XRE-family HTH domain
MEKTAKQELVRRCADLMGREQLAARLGISTALLDAWIRGEVTMPNGQLLPLAASLNQLAEKESLGKKLPDDFSPQE